MSEESKAAVDTAALDQKISAVERDVQALKDAMAGGARVRLCLIVAILVLIIGVIMAFKSMVEDITSDESLEALRAEVEKRLELNQDEYAGELKKLVENSQPVVTAALQDRFTKDQNRYIKALNDEKAALEKNLQEGIRGLIQDKYAGLLDEHMDLIGEEFPTASDEKAKERLMENVILAMNRLIERYYVDSLQAQLQALYATWEDFPPADDPAEDDEPLEDQLMGTLWELLVEIVARQSEAGADAPTIDIPASE